MRLIISFLKKVDAFGETIQMQFEKKAKFNTVLGGVLSCIIYILTFALIVSLFEQLVSRSNPRTNSSTLYKNYGPQINFEKDYLRFGFGFYESGIVAFDDPSYFTFSVNSFILDKRNGSSPPYKPVIPIDRCGTFENVFVTDRFNYTKLEIDNQVNKFNCLKNYSLSVEGSFSELYYENIQIKMMRCKNSTSKVLCKSDQEINSKLSGGYFELYYSNRYIDVTDYNQPIKEYWEVYFVSLDPYSSRISDLFFKRINITSDKGLILEDLSTESQAMFDYYREQFDTKAAETTIIKLSLNSSKNFMSVNRTYFKLTDLTAVVGGIFNLCMIFGEKVASLISNTQVKMKIMNTLFYFDSQEESENFSSYKDNNSSLNQKSKSSSAIVNEIELKDSNINTHREDQNETKLKHLGVKFSGRSNSPRKRTNTDVKREKFLLNEIKKTIIEDIESEGLNEGMESNRIQLLSSNRELFSADKGMILSNRSKSNLHEISGMNSNAIEEPLKTDTNLLIITERNTLRKSSDEDGKNNAMIDLSDPSLKQEPVKMDEKTGTKYRNLIYIKKQSTEKNHENKERKKSSGSNDLEKYLQHKLTLRMNFSGLKQKVFVKIREFQNSTDGQFKASFCEIIAMKTFYCCVQKYKNLSLTYDEGLNKLNYYLDYLEIVKHLQEFDKLKTILFTEDQGKLFKCLTKPCIMQDQEILKQKEAENNLEQEELERKEELEDTALNITDIDKIYTSFEKIRDKTSKTEFDQKLLNNLDQDLKLPFELLYAREKQLIVS